MVVINPRVVDVVDTVPHSFADLFDNTVTFNMPDATMEFPTFEANNAGDIWFQFKTTATDGVMVHCTGDPDFIEIRLFRKWTVLCLWVCGCLGCE